MSLRGHKGEIRDLAWSPDGKLLASAGSDKTVRIWTLETRQAHVIPIPESEPRNVTFSPDGTKLAFGRTVEGGGAFGIVDSVQGLIGFWDVTTGELLGEILAHRQSLNTLSWSPDGEMLASGGSDARVRLWPMSMSKLLQLIPVRLKWFVLPPSECERYFGTTTCPPAQ